jgi:hypothetical protein
VEREPGFLEQNIRLVRQEVSTIASQLQMVVFYSCYPCNIFAISVCTCIGRYVANETGGGMLGWVCNSEWGKTSLCTYTSHN